MAVPHKPLHARNQIARLLVCLFAVVSLFPRITAQESSGPAYHSAASEVRIVFFVTDEHDHAVTDLKKSDFAVVDNEQVIRDFRSFTRSAPVKLDVVLLFDSSESVLPHFKQEITAVLQLISQWPWNPQDNLSVLTFSGAETHPLCAEDCRSSFTADRIASLPAGGTTPLFDALVTATGLLSKRRPADTCPVIILFSDGDDTIGTTSLGRALEKILASEAQVYAVDVGTPAPASNGTATLQEIARDSGGRYIPAGDDLVAITGKIIDDLHSTFILTYAPPASTSEFHSVRLLPTHNLNLQFRSRRGYYHRSGIAPSEDRP